jgi:hypothetical protein
VGLKEYNIKSGRRNAIDTTVLLSDEDAKAQGLTAKDLASKGDQMVDASNPEFKPETEADLDPNAAEAAAAAVEAAKREQARVEAEQAEQLRLAEAEAQRVADAEKQAASTKNKARGAATNKAAAPADEK